MGDLYRFLHTNVTFIRPSWQKRRWKVDELHVGNLKKETGCEQTGRNTIWQRYCRDAAKKVPILEYVLNYPKNVLPHWTPNVYSISPLGCETKVGSV